MYFLLQVPEEKCWTVKDIKCHQVSSTSCHKVPDKKCWKVHVKKNRYVKRKECQKCNRWQEKYTTKQKKNNCKLVPRQECRTIYFNDCKKIPQKSCKTKYRNNCKKVQNCETKYNTHCEKAKPTYGKPTYGAPKEVCTQVPYEKCHYSKKCDKVPYEQCSTKYRNQCKKVPQQKCVTLKDLKCTPVWVEVPKTRTKKSCSWGPKKHQDKFCYRRWREQNWDLILNVFPQVRLWCSIGCSFWLRDKHSVHRSDYGRSSRLYWDIPRQLRWIAQHHNGSGLDKIGPEHFIETYLFIETYH